MMLERLRPVVLSVGSALVTLATASIACTPVEEDATDGTCKKDFDCPVNQLCQGATAEAEGTCGAASATATRNFGEASLSFATGNEVYLLAVYDVPTAEASSSESPAPFVLKNAGGPAGALRLSPARLPADTLAAERRFLEARIELERQRRADLDVLAGEVREGRASLVKNVTTKAASSCSAPCSNTQMCWKGACTATPSVKFATGSTVTCNVVGTVVEGSLEVKVLVDAADSTSTPNALATAEDFAAAAKEVLYLMGLDQGHTGKLDLDQSGGMAVVFSEKLSTIGSGDVVGYFDFKDMLPATNSQATGNESDVLWARAPDADTMASCRPSGCDTITPELAVATLAHEYQHLANFAKRALEDGGSLDQREVLWLDEGLAHLTEDLVGWGASNLGAVAVALDNWPAGTLASGTDTVEQRGKAYLFLRHLVDQKARGAGASTASGSQVRTAARELITSLLTSSETGFDHAALRTNAASTLWKSLLGVYATGNADVTDATAKTSNFLTVASSAVPNQQLGINPRGEVVTARGAELQLAGPTLGDGSVDELTNFNPAVESEIPPSGSLLFEVRADAAGTVVVGGEGPAALDLKLSAQRVQ